MKEIPKYEVSASVIKACIYIIEGAYRDFNYSSIEEQRKAGGFPAAYYELFKVLNSNGEDTISELLDVMENKNVR